MRHRLSGMGIHHRQAPEEAFLQPRMGLTMTLIAEMYARALTLRGLETVLQEAWTWLDVSRSSTRLPAAPTTVQETCPPQAFEEIPAMAQNRWAASSVWIGSEMARQQPLRMLDSAVSIEAAQRDCCNRAATVRRQSQLFLLLQAATNRGTRWCRSAHRLAPSRNRVGDRQWHKVAGFLCLRHRTNDATQVVVAMVLMEWRLPHRRSRDTAAHVAARQQHRR